MIRDHRSALALAAFCAILTVVVLLAGCAACPKPSLTRCDGDVVSICAGGYWRTVRDCRDVGPASFQCVEEPGAVAACLPRVDP